MQCATIVSFCKVLSKWRERKLFKSQSAFGWTLHQVTFCLFRVLPLPGSCLASGDENGIIKTWDWRAKSCTAELKTHSDFISDLKLNEAEHCLVAVSGDGCLSFSDLKTQKVCILLLTTMASASQELARCLKFR